MFLLLRTTLAAVVLLAGTAVAAGAATTSGELDVVIVKAPIAPDGTVAGAAADFVITFADRDPSVEGIAMKNGGTIEVVLPDDFVNTGAGGNTVVILQGWPQSPRVPFPYATDISGNTITLTMTGDWPVGTFGPGPKQVHLVLFGFTNPRTGRYRIPLTIQPDPMSSDVLHGEGVVEILSKARPSVNAISLFTGAPGPPPPFFNPVYQTVSQGDDARQVGLYLWGKDSAPFLGIDVWMSDPHDDDDSSDDSSSDDESSEERNRRHGRFVDVETGRTVGHVWMDGPGGARTFGLSTTGPSTLANAFVTGVPVGLLLTQFMPDPATTGDYVITMQMNQGNREQLFVTVVP